jgi:hypothetical protein
MSEDWGPWIEHDGKGCPLPVGTAYSAFDVWADGHEEYFEAFAGERGGFSWDWQWSLGSPPGHKYAATRIVRYRVRKPRGLTILEGLLSDLPETVDA